MTNRVIEVVGLGFGDETKGGTVDYVTRKEKAHTIVRFNGGSQALHHVVRPGRHGTHGFSQFGSGTFSPGVQTYLSRFMLVDPLFMQEESQQLNRKGVKQIRGKVTVDRDCVIATPFHRIANQMTEISRKEGRLGSCGRGIGQAMTDWQRMKNDTLLAGDLIDWQCIFRKLKYLLSLKIDFAEQLIDEDPDNLELWVELGKLREYYSVEGLTRLTQHYNDLFKFNYFKLGDNQILKNLLDKNGVVIFEGAQGVLLDPRYGFVPYVTKTKTTFENVDELLRELDYGGEVIRLGVLRAYSTRHGAGPFVTEDDELSKLIPEHHNGTNDWQGKFRLGHFDAVATRYAIEVCGGSETFDGLVIGCLDRLFVLDSWKICDRYFDGIYYPELVSKKTLNRLRELYRYSAKDERMIDAIKVFQSGEESRIEHQTQLAWHLGSCYPEYTTMERGKVENLERAYQTYLGMIEERLKIPIVLCSYGPTHKDKIQVRPLS